MSAVRYSIGAIADEVLASVREPAVVKTAEAVTVAPQTDVGQMLKQAAALLRQAPTDVTFEDLEKVAMSTTAVAKGVSIPKVPTAPAAGTAPAASLRPAATGNTAGTGGSPNRVAADTATVGRTSTASTGSELGNSLRVLADAVRAKSAQDAAARQEKAAQVLVAATGLKTLMGGVSR